MADQPVKTAAKAVQPVMDLSDLFEHALKDIYYAEKKIYKSLPKMIKAAQDPALKDGLSSHRDETAGQIEVLEEVFAILGQRPKAEKCDAIDGILEESTSLLEDFKGSTAMDAAIIFSAQAVEHYEITRYGSMHAYATVLGMQDAADLIAGILKQEKAADVTLTSLAEGRVNAAAA
jgi:ferritin-like metal-binding protein YciE